VVKVGIDAFAIYTPRYVLELADLAEARCTDPDKYHTGLGQFAMSVAPPGEDIVTMAANAAQQALAGVDIQSIDMLLFATESGIDQSKAAGMYVHELLGLSTHCRVAELKQACYGATAALQLALPYLREHPERKILLIASDIARYGLNTPGESSQGAGAIAMVLSTNPRIIAFEKGHGVAADSVMDFWRPNYSHEAFVDGKYSSKLYLTMLEKSFLHYQQTTQRTFHDHDYYCYHTPVPRLVEKAHQHFLKINGQTQLPPEMSENQYQFSLEYGRNIGNSYTAALYIGLASLLDHHADNLAGKRIGFYSYGSGCVAEYFSGVIQPGYREALPTAYHAQLLATRERLTYQQYEAFFQFAYVEDGSEQAVPHYQTGHFRLVKLQQHKRIYEKLINEALVASPMTISAKKKASEQAEKKTLFRVSAPGKLILSGEHAVVYGQPALAMAVNRYVTATISHEAVPQVAFDLSDLSYRSRLSFYALHHLKEKIKRKYHSFIRGDFSIRDVLQKPFELAQFALGIFAEAMDLSVPQGMKIQIQSDLPIGCGMGSSAATIVSVMQAIAHYYQVPLTKDKLFQLALQAENMQHGYSSGIDLRVIMQGGCLFAHGDQVEQRQLPELPMLLINTGTPNSTTGQCTEKAAIHFASSSLKDEFAAVTRAMDAALSAKSWGAMQEAIRENHRLLVQIGVVPEKVQQFIADIEQAGGAAKICGAGSVTGDQAGAVLVSAEDEKVIQLITHRYGYHMAPIVASERGVHAA
jgi:hydroxymethylglutaryl-CoA synthase